MLGGVGFGNSQIGVEHFLKEHSFPVAGSWNNSVFTRKRSGRKPPPLKIAPKQKRYPMTSRTSQPLTFWSIDKLLLRGGIPTSAWVRLFLILAIGIGKRDVAREVKIIESHAYACRLENC
eukprot:scaffold4396_cov145-Skeletonema_marinoi.AAC.3